MERRDPADSEVCPSLEMYSAHSIRLLRGPQPTFSSAQGLCVADSCSGCPLSSLHLLQVRSYMRQVLEGICYLHQHSVLHLDIKVSVGLYRFLLPSASSKGLLVHWGRMVLLTGNIRSLGNAPASCQTPLCSALSCSQKTS